MKPIVSVIMSIYNGEQYLKEAIESILAQTYKDFEFIIIDDASIDDTPRILSQYMQYDRRIIVLTNARNLGLTRSLNKGIEAARGEYVARMDADDSALPERLAMQIAFLDAHPEYGLVGTWAQVIDEKGKQIGTFAWEHTDVDIRKTLIRYNNIIHPSVMMRRSAVEKAGLYDESFRYAQDYDLFLRMVARSKAAAIPQYLLKYRVSDDSITGSKNRAQAWCTVRARWNAIKRREYPLYAVLYIFRPLIGMILPLWLKRIVKKTAV